MLAKKVSGDIMNADVYNNKYEIILNKIVIFFAIIAGIALTIMMLITALDVILRLFNKSIIGAFEVVEFLMGVVVPLSLAYCEKKREHICVDLIVQHFPKKSQPWFDLITSIATMVFFWIIAYECFLNIFGVRADHLTSSVLLWATWPWTIPCSLGFALTSLLLINHCIRVAKTIYRGNYGA